MANIKIIDRDEACGLMPGSNSEFAFIQNPGYIHPRFDIVPLASRITSHAPYFLGAVMDMDGTTTTTEELCIHSLEYMIRKMSGRMSLSDWQGLDPEQDYPNIIGNSTTKHVEYLLNRYQPLLNATDIKAALFFARIWTLVKGKDQQRKDEVERNLKNSGFSEITDLAKSLPSDYSDLKIKETAQKYAKKLKGDFTPDELTRAGIDIYYQKYHEILERIRQGESTKVSDEIFGDPQKKLIEPMPGIEIFLPLIKGWLGKDIKKLSGKLIDSAIKKGIDTDKIPDEAQLNNALVSVSDRFTRRPLKTAIVTSSIFYEADIVLSEVFRQINNFINNSDLPELTKEKISVGMQTYGKYYETVVTACDSSEIRLKPHRDLYSIALHQLGFTPDKFDKVLGFEDSESGTVAIRAAGLGRCIALPFAETSGHDLAAAAKICKCGIPEIIIRNKVFLDGIDG